MTRKIVWLIVMAACGGGSGGIEPNQLPGELARASCSRLAECCTPAEFKQAALGADSVAQCEAAFTAFAGILTTVLNDSIAKNRVIYHADRMGDCMAAFADASCGEPSTGGAPANCGGAFEPLVANGGQCGDDFDCTSGYCSGESTDFNGSITYGVCAAAPAVGDACDQNQCGPGAFCEFGPSPTCVAAKSDGSQCTSDSQCSSDHCNGAGGGGPGTCGAQTTCDGM